MGSLTKQQKAIIVGCLLGDGAMRCKANALLEINHSAKQKDYVNWKFEQLKNLTSTFPRLRKGNAKRIAYRFTTRSLPELTKIYRLFYKQGRKVIPQKLALHPLSLAIWFMDDGCKSYNAVYLNTQKFTKEEQKRLIKLLKNQFGIISTLNKDKIYYRLRIAVDSVGRLKKLIKPDLLSCFLYKFPITP